MSKKQRYQKKDPIEHVLTRSDMYVGSLKEKDSNEYIYIDNKIVEKNIKISPALLRIFIEILSNAIDNATRSLITKTKCTTIKVNIDKKTGKTTVWNDGDIIPVQLHETEGVYNHSLIFGQLLTGSNYDDDEDRVISGRNGLGATCTNILSTQFVVKGCDPVNKKFFEQTWSNNMKDVNEPIITPMKIKTKGYTEVSYIPDFKHFGLKGYSNNIIDFYHKYVIDTAMLLSSVKVYFNDVLIDNMTLHKYASLYDEFEDYILVKSSDSNVLVCPSNDDSNRVISFVNGVYTKLGGCHVEAYNEAIFRPILDKLVKKNANMTIKDIKGHFNLYVISTVSKPEFSSQTKDKLESPKIEAVIKTADINKMLKWSCIEDIKNMMQLKDLSKLKKTEKKGKKVLKIDGYDKANLSASKSSSECSLILCEGLSAKTYAVAGISKGVFGKSGRDYFGILPLRGKVINVRNATIDQIAKNTVITNIIQVLNLKYDVDYTDDKNFKSLSYGRIILLCDADVDGLHISGLILNFFHTLFPTLLNRDPSFIVTLATPIIRVYGKTKKNDILFYDESNFKNYHRDHPNIKYKYYKGLGTTKAEDVKDTFGMKIVSYKTDEKTNDNMYHVFNKLDTDYRKLWIENYKVDNSLSLDVKVDKIDMTISNFLNNEVIKFSINDCMRSIPNVYDGLKESQRKILYCVKKRNLSFKKTSLKVAQLGGYVAEHSNYSHGEQNLYDTIVKMAQDFIGSNNIPLLYRDGMFGTILNNGKDASSARYIYTKMDALTHLIFKEEDDVLLDYKQEDGDSIEPRFYLPIIPMILINGATSIATGWSCNIPCHNVKDIVVCIKKFLNNNNAIFINDDTSILPDIKPWYKGFKGDIEKVGDKCITTGLVVEVSSKIMRVTQLPIGMSAEKFKENLDDLLDEKKIKKYDNYSTPIDIRFDIHVDSSFECTVESLKLTSSLNMSNMVCYDKDDKIKKYNVDEIINEFCIQRFDMYVKRKKYQLNSLKNNIDLLNAKYVFISGVMNKELKIMNVKECDIIEQLVAKKFIKINEKYDYLLTMHIRSFTVEKLKELKDEIDDNKMKYTSIEGKSEKNMWIEELDELIVAYDKM